MKAIFIDAKNQQVSYVENKGQLEDLYRILEVDMIEIAEHWKNGDTLYVDEEGLINGTNFGFEINGHQYMGNGLVYGLDINSENGNGSALTRLEDLKVKFFQLEPAI